MSKQCENPNKMSSDKPINNESSDADSNRTEPEPIDPTLDVTSELFDPLKALYSETVHIPVKNAKVFDNISIFESYMARKVSAKGTAASKSSTSKASTSKAENPFERRFLPHQSTFFCGLHPLQFEN